MRCSSSAPHSAPRRRLALAVVALTFLAAGCELDVRVAVDVEADGGGRVEATFTLDRDAARQVGDLGDQLRVDDLVRAGWEVTGPTRGRDGSVVVAAERGFDGPKGAALAIEQLSGDDGPFRDFRIERDSSFTRTKTRFSGRVDLEAGLDAFGDDDLRRRLGEPLGVEAEAIERQFGAALSDIFGFEVVVRLPGDVESNAPDEFDNGARWRPKLGENASLAARAEQWNAASIAFSVLALATGASTAAVLVVLIRGRRRRRRPAHAVSRRS